MQKIKISDIDELYSILLDLCAITYLQNVIIDLGENSSIFSGVEFSAGSIQYYLLDGQIETVLKFREFFDKRICKKQITY